MFINKQNKLNLKTNVMTINKMFDLNKLIDKEPKLFEELCSKYSIKTKQCIYIIQYLSDVQDDNPSNDILNDTPLDETCQETYPDDFQPLYKLGEIVKIADGKSIESIVIKKITFVIDTYYYEYDVNGTGNIEEKNEEWLVEHEVIEE